MLDPEPHVPRTETFAQSFSITYDYPVHFTRDLFDPRNPCLRRVLMSRPQAQSQRLAVFIDEGVTLAWPELVDRIVDHAATHAAAMKIAGDVVVVPGARQSRTSTIAWKPS